MKIRHATKYDARSIINMLWHYNDTGVIEGLNVNEQTLLKVVTHILAGAGIALVAEKNNKLVGMLIASKVPFLWDNSKYIMNEIAYWVEVEHRGGTAGYKLIKEYVKECEQMKDEAMIAKYTISQMEGQTLNYSRFGFKPIEHTWST